MTHSVSRLTMGLIIVMFAPFFWGGPALAADRAQAEDLLRDFVEDYIRNDKLPETPVSFGIRITGPKALDFTLAIDSRSEGKVKLLPGFPKQPTFYMAADLETLRKIHAGEMNVLTAAGRARMSDKTPLDIGFMEGFSPSPDFMSGVMFPLGFHFFTRGRPEIIPFGEEYSRLVHGGNTVLFYYQKGIRTAWYQVKKGMKINRDLQDATNPFATLFVITKGRGKGRLGDRVLNLEAGQTLFVPPGMIHQFWSEDEAGMEFIIIMFGEGA